MKIALIKGIENDQQRSHGDSPGDPTLLHHPPEGNPPEVAEKKRWVANGREATADIADNENEKDDVKSRDTVFIHTNPRANKEHRGAGGSYEISKDRSDEQKKAIHERFCFAFNVDVDPSSDYEQRADEYDETGIFLRDVEHASGIVEEKDVVGCGDCAQAHRHFGEMSLPPMEIDEWHERNSQEHRHKGQDHQRMRLWWCCGSNEAGIEHVV